MRGLRVWSEVNLAAVEHNLRTVRSRLRPGTRILGVVKADAYGHGARAVAGTLLRSGCSMLGVGDSTEALELREGGITEPILILGAIIEEEITRVVEHDISVSVHSPDLLRRLNAEALRRGRTLRIHLKIDTGMGRLGCSPSSALSLAREIIGCPSLRLEGVSTHIATRETEITEAQLRVFRQGLREMREEGIQPSVVHASNSVALFTVPESHFDMVRPGIALYGMDPGELAPFGLRPALTLKTRIAYLKSLPAGSGVGYDHRFITRRPTRVATCPVGYNDGYPQTLSNRSHAIVLGRRVPLIGTVTMDYIMLDVTDVPECATGEEVTLFGRDIRVEELARTIGTIPYAIPCGLGKRVKRIYVRDEEKSDAARTVA